MGKVMTAANFVEKAIDAAKNHTTLYVMGCFGAPMTAYNKQRYTTNNEYNRRPERTAMINAATENTFGFDCVCLIKGLLWGWKADKSKIYGGASYASNGVPDIGADSMINVCSGISTNFSNIVPGEVVWKSGHIGIYIGNGLAVESTPAWANKVQITAVANIGSKSGYNSRTWTKHGKLPYVDYSVTTTPDPQPEEPAPEPAPDPAPPEEKVYTRSEVEEIIKDVFQRNFEEARKKLQDNDASKWSETARAWAIENGMIAGIGNLPDGTPNYAWEDFVTREQLMTILFRYDTKK